MYIEALIELLQTLGLASKRDLLPCNARQIEEVRKAFGVNELPMAYDEFLGHMGWGAGRFLMDTTATYPLALENRNSAKEIADHTGKWALPDEVIVIDVHDGYTFAYMMPDGPNPEVHSYLEGEALPKATGLNFVEFMFAVARDSGRCNRPKDA